MDYLSGSKYTNDDDLVELQQLLGLEASNGGHHFLKNLYDPIEGEAKNLATTAIRSGPKQIER